MSVPKVVGYPFPQPITVAKPVISDVGWSSRPSLPRLVGNVQFIDPGGKGPTISSFFGMIIQMFWNDHAPPHFRCQYREYEVLIDIRTLEVMEGKLPRRALNLVLDWAELHKAELLEDWELCSNKQQPKPIAPLE